MREKVAANVANAVFAIVLAMVVGVLTSQVDPTPGWPLIAVGVLIVAAAALCVLPGDHFKDWKRKALPVGFMIAGAVLCVVGAYWYYLEHSDRQNVPSVSFQKIAFFWVEADTNIYEIGIVMKLFNLDGRPYLINGMAFDWIGQPKITGRGVAHLLTYDQFMDHDEIVEDNYIKAGDEGCYKRLLPIKVRMTITGGPPPEFFLVANWNFLFGKQRIKVSPEFHATHDAVLSRAEWNALLKPGSQIKVDDLAYTRVTERVR